MAELKKNERMTNQITPKAARESLGLSRSEMAEVMGVYYNTWGKWERGERAPDSAAVRLMQILEWLGPWEIKQFMKYLEGLK